MKSVAGVVLFLMVFAIGMYCHASDTEMKRNWPRFRGPDGLGVSFYTNIPSSWNGKAGEGIRWKTVIPLPGVSSPIVWDDRVFLTGATRKQREIYCLDANSGKLLWKKLVDNIPFSQPASLDVSEDTGFAASTAATDGERVYAIFANGDLICLDFNGEHIWARSMGFIDNMYGHASSLIMHQNLLIIQLDQARTEDNLSSLIAIEATTGKIAWNTERPVPNSWTTPIIINTGEHEEIITCANPWIIAYDPNTGEELWKAKCLSGDVAPSPVYADGLVYVTNTFAVLAAIRPGGKGDVTETHIIWSAEDGLPDICSPLANEELVFLLETYGFLTCYNAKNGEIVWEKDLEEAFEASPSLAGDKVYLMTQDGVMIIIEAGREFREIGRCELGEKSRASPAFMDGRIYIRGEENLYCITGR